jgi:hypothetical protein
LIEQLVDAEAGRSRCAGDLENLADPLTTATVEALPFLSTLSNTER